MFIGLLTNRKEINFMGKKYVPSGYQIINIGNIDLSSPLTFTKGDGSNKDIQLLIDIVEEITNKEEILKKPILFSCYDENRDSYYSGFLTQSSIGKLSLFGNNNFYIQISHTGTNEIIIEEVEY